MKLSRISRVIKLLTVLQSGRRYSVGELIEQTGVCRRTIFRDLNVLQEIGIPYSFDEKHGGYGIDPQFFLPSLDLNLQEALALLMLVHEGAKHLPLPYRNSAVMGGLKIENNLPDRMQRYCNATLDNVSIKPDSHAPMESLDHTFQQLQKACHQKQKVQIEYTSSSDKNESTVSQSNNTTTPLPSAKGCHPKQTNDFQNNKRSAILNPYHILYNNRAWYVVGYSGRHKEIRTFKLNRINKLTILNKRFVVDKRFDISDYFGRAWSMIPEGRLYNVRLRFSAKVARNVCEVQWHATQKAEQNEDGSVDLEFRVDGLGEIKWWVLGYGDQVEVIKPAALRKTIATMAQRMADNNQS